MSKLKKVLCALFGHPPAVTSFMGYESCARCDEQIADSVAGTGSGLALVGNNCDHCERVWKSARRIDRLLTPKVITGPIVSAEERDRERRIAAIERMFK